MRKYFPRPGTLPPHFIKNASLEKRAAAVLETLLRFYPSTENNTRDTTIQNFCMQETNDELVIWSCTLNNRALKTYNATSSTTRFGNKEICHAKQQLRTICSPKGIPNGIIVLNTTSNLELLRLFSNMKAEYDVAAVQADSKASIASFE